ncbi:MAG: DUF1152 domain-containing protein [Aggregatilineales bacterium]
MKLNLPILDQLQDAQTILIAGAGGGFDIFAGLPIYFTLREMGKTVHLANYSFMDFKLACALDKPEIIEEGLVMGTRGKTRLDLGYYPEAYLSQWFKATRDEDMIVWMFPKMGVQAIKSAYQTLIAHLGGVDAIILVDGGVDSIMRGDEAGAGTLMEDTISTGAVQMLDDVPIKILACVGFGTEVEEAVCHHHALENIAALMMEKAFYGSCALAPQMDAFKQYESACRFAWEQPNRHKSHISTRIIPAVHGNFGNYAMYEEFRHSTGLISPLMSLYWFFESDAVTRRSLLLDDIRETYTFEEAFQIIARKRISMSLRPRKSIPY